MCPVPASCVRLFLVNNGRVMPMSRSPPQPTAPSRPRARGTVIGLTPGSNEPEESRTHARSPNTTEVGLSASASMSSTSHLPADQTDLNLPNYPTCLPSAHNAPVITHSPHPNKAGPQRSNDSNQPDTTSITHSPGSNLGAVWVAPGAASGISKSIRDSNCSSGSSSSTGLALSNASATMTLVSPASDAIAALPVVFSDFLEVNDFPAVSVFGEFDCQPGLYRLLWTFAGLHHNARLCAGRVIEDPSGAIIDHGFQLVSLVCSETTASLVFTVEDGVRVSTQLFSGWSEPRAISSGRGQSVPAVEFDGCEHKAQIVMPFPGQYTLAIACKFGSHGGLFRHTVCVLLQGFPLGGHSARDA